MSSSQRLVYLVRHAKSSWDDPSLDDLERPLNKRGQKAAPEMGRRLVAQGHAPELILSSPARRAFATATLIARQLGYEEDRIAVRRELYFEGVRGMQRALEQVDDAVRSVMLTGHNPTMTQWLLQLTGASVWNMPTAAIGIVGLPDRPWSEAASMAGELLGYDTPKGSGRFDLD